ncbi:hypothetical protein RRG08_033647 [Elysia crispata]|uniref:Uncharacterized protein n=1 Tax=Elysia crispata TaxID=231223 RepID=A0AAE1B7C5_9GAST|nr:hypothetical protein RRG08_033647 [Elysia crispata]
MAQGKLVHIIISTADRKSVRRRFVVFQRTRPRIMIVSRKSYKNRYNQTEDGYRQRFRTCSPEEGDNPNMFIVRPKTYLERWMKLAEAPQTYDALRDLFVKEQFLDSSG